MVLWVVPVLTISAGTGWVILDLRKDCAFLGPAERFWFGSVHEVPCLPGYVVNAGSGVVVFPSGEALDWDERRRVFVDERRGVRFQLDGSSLEAQFLEPLPRCELKRAKDGDLYIVSIQECRKRATEARTANPSA